GGKNLIWWIAFRLITTNLVNLHKSWPEFEHKCCLKVSCMLQLNALEAGKYVLVLLRFDKVKPACDYNLHIARISAVSESQVNSFVQEETVLVVSIEQYYL